MQFDPRYWLSSPARAASFGAMRGWTPPEWEITAAMRKSSLIDAAAALHRFHEDVKGGGKTGRLDKETKIAYYLSRAGSGRYDFRAGPAAVNEWLRKVGGLDVDTSHKYKKDPLAYMIAHEPPPGIIVAPVAAIKPFTDWTFNKRKQQEVKPLTEGELAARFASIPIEYFR